MENKTDYYRMASGFYQFKDLPDNYLDLDVEELDKLLEENAWHPFEGYLGCDIDEQIEGLAWRFQEVARQERLRTLKELEGKQ